MRLARPLIALLVTLGFNACGSGKLTLPPCWHAADLQQGERFSGTVLIFAASGILPMIFPVACDGGIIAALPDGVRLSTHKKGGSPEDDVGMFYRAHVVGQVEGFEFGRPSVRLERVTSPKQVIPSWSRRDVR